jgi:hypothetical protein
VLTEHDRRNSAQHPLCGCEYSPPCECECKAIDLPRVVLCGPLLQAPLNTPGRCRPVGTQALMYSFWAMHTHHQYLLAVQHTD